ncbi:NPP1 family protein [Streptomyces sp. NPDC002644]
MSGRNASPARPRTRRTARALTTTGGALALLLALAGPAQAAPPAALPANATALERQFQPALDYDKDGCYPTPAIGPDGSLNGGLNPTGALNGDCRDSFDLGNTNAYSRATCNNGWCAVLYGLYFEKDQALAGTSIGGHRHDWEHIVVWVEQATNTARHVATSNHGSFTVHSRDRIPWEGTHPKVVYHKDGVSTHCFRAASAGDEPPENHRGTWQYPPLVGWGGYPAGLRDRLSQANWGSANFGLTDSSYVSHLEKAKPAGIPFVPSL